MPAAADTAQPSDTTPPSPAAAGKGGKRASSKAPEAAAADQATVAPADDPTEATDATEDVAAEDAPPKPEPGWFRNTAKTPLTVIPDQYPAARLEPDEAAWLPDDPHHPNLERCEAPEPSPAPDAAADDTAGSEK